MEIFDVIDDFGNPTGETVERSYAHKYGIKHRTSHIWVVRENDGKVEVLLQRRAKDKDSFPDSFDTSSSGHINAGDEPLESAKRELFEELGIDASLEDLQFAGTFVVDYEMPFHGEMFKDKEVAFVYIYDKPVELSDLRFSDSEVQYCKWFDIDYVQTRFDTKDSEFCIPPGGFKIAKEWCKKNK